MADKTVMSTASETKMTRAAGHHHADDEQREHRHERCAADYAQDAEHLERKGDLAIGRRRAFVEVESVLDAVVLTHGDVLLECVSICRVKV